MGYGLLVIAVASMAAMDGKVYVGTTMNTAKRSEEISLKFETNDARLGTNSGNTYTSQAEQETGDARLVYGTALNIQIRQQHSLAVEIEGQHDWKRAIGDRTETITSKDGMRVSQAGGGYNHPQDRLGNILAGVKYTYNLKRKGETLTIGYRYHWDYTTLELEQQIKERSGWALYEMNQLNQQINKQEHKAWLEYVCPIVRGHAIEIATIWERRQIDSHTEQEWDRQSHLNADYRHLTQYGGLAARYKMNIGPVKAQAGLEYRATKMQERWLHDVIPTVMVRWQVDSVNALMGGYRMLIIRPLAEQLDTNRIRDAYTQSFGNNDLIGVHVHRTNLTYQMVMKNVRFSTELGYLTTKDGLNALWMERNNVRIYTWGNEGIRHAVNLTPMVDGRLGQTTRLVAEATVLWDERIAAAINMANANWGISGKVRLEQALPKEMAIGVEGNYSYHNTLNLYSYAGHGGKIGVDWKIALLKQKNLELKAGYACKWIPDVVITQGGWTGVETYIPKCSHQIQIRMDYKF